MPQLDYLDHPTVALVGCVKIKASTCCPAKDLYLSPLFRYMKRYAETRADSWYILSARYGLLHPDRQVQPYNETLSEMTASQRRVWASTVLGQLLEVLSERTEVMFLAGDLYRSSLLPQLEVRGFPCSVPFLGLAIGRQLGKLKGIFGSL